MIPYVTTTGIYVIIGCVVVWIMISAAIVIIVSINSSNKSQGK